MTKEVQLVPAVLLSLAAAPGHRLNTSDLRSRVKAMVVLDGDDRKPLRGRSDVRIDQYVRNMKCHRRHAGNPIFDGLVEDITGGFQLTPEGLDEVRKMVGRMMK